MKNDEEQLDKYLNYIDVSRDNINKLLDLYFEGDRENVRRLYNAYIAYYLSAQLFSNALICIHATYGKKIHISKDIYNKYYNDGMRNKLFKLEVRFVDEGDEHYLLIEPTIME